MARVAIGLYEQKKCLIESKSFFRSGKRKRKCAFVLMDIILSHLSAVDWLIAGHLAPDWPIVK
jgi:hypothetical protein